MNESLSSVMQADKSKPLTIEDDEVCFRCFESEKDLQTVVDMMVEQLSEPYPIYTYRYFVQKWPELCILAYLKSNPDKIIASIVSKLDY